jgi:hypothetical protein
VFPWAIREILAAGVGGIVRGVQRSSPCSRSGSVAGLRCRGRIAVAGHGSRCRRPEVASPTWPRIWARALRGGTAWLHQEGRDLKPFYCSPSWRSARDEQGLSPNKRWGATAGELHRACHRGPVVVPWGFPRLVVGWSKPRRSQILDRALGISRQRR